jgi:hypothetical protein
MEVAFDNGRIELDLIIRGAERCLFPFEGERRYCVVGED